MLPSNLSVHPEVREALEAQKPVVALESTVISHGLPWPENFELARRLEARVRARGATPATIALLRGEVRVGLTEAEIEHVARTPGIWKISRRDYAVAAAQKRDGATTVAGTMIAAHWAGIRVFATGGIGGVHRAVISDPSSVASREASPITDHRSRITSYSLDISADLPELARTPVMVVCAGAKAILDLPATLEWLETHGVPVVGYQTDKFPLFYTRTSRLPVSARADTPEEVVAIAQEHWALGMESAVLIAVPPPLEVALPEEDLVEAIRQALEEARKERLRGQQVTPFLLERVSELTGRESLRANLGLLRNNANVAAEIARAF